MHQTLELNPLVSYTGTGYAGCEWDAGYQPSQAIADNHLNSSLCNPSVTQLTVYIHLGLGEPCIQIQVSNRFVITVGDLLRAIYDALMEPIPQPVADALCQAKRLRIAARAHGRQQLYIDILEGSQRFMGVRTRQIEGQTLSVDVYFAR
ncbi:hypothetical protein AURDEDRAFT_166464 [Auricularia subglabra TFB-10046 SS5]|nr:hypothetical protein AURDEDRAFT_166464 [Auricularia subglabra TFB-10046 SS5]